MKNFYYMILCAAAILFSGCDNQANFNMDYISKSQEGQYKIDAYFMTEQKIPLTVIIHDMSGGGDIVYDFGDGETYKATSKETIEHKYIQEGTYKIKVTVTYDQQKKEYSKNITVNAPSKIYVTAVEFLGLSKSGFHCFQLQKKNGSSYVDLIDTEYMKITSDQLPKLIYVSPAQLSTGGNVYRVLVKGCGNELGLLHTTYISSTFQSVALLLYSDYFEYTNESLKVRMHFTYEQ